MSNEINFEVKNFKFTYYITLSKESFFIWRVKNFIYHVTSKSEEEISLKYKYQQIKELELIEDDQNSTKKTVVGAIVAGGLGAIANNLVKSKNYSLFIGLNDGNTLVIPCSDKNILKELIYAFSSKMPKKIEDSSIDSNTTSLESKLVNLKAVFEKGLLTKEEYEQKRKRIIDND